MYNFNYLTTSYICVTCLDGVNDCGELINTQHMDVEIRSVSDFTKISIGMIQSYTADLENCFDELKNTVRVSGSGTKIELVSNKKCGYLFNNPDPNLVLVVDNATLQITS